MDTELNLDYLTRALVIASRVDAYRDGTDLSRVVAQLRSVGLDSGITRPLLLEIGGALDSEQIEKLVVKPLDATEIYTVLATFMESEMCDEVLYLRKLARAIGLDSHSTELVNKQLDGLEASTCA